MYLGIDQLAIRARNRLLEVRPLLSYIDRRPEIKVAITDFYSVREARNKEYRGFVFVFFFSNSVLLANIARTFSESF